MSSDVIEYGTIKVGDSVMVVDDGAMRPAQLAPGTLGTVAEIDNNDDTVRVRYTLGGYVGRRWCSRVIPAPAPPAPRFTAGQRVKVLAVVVEDGLDLAGEVWFKTRSGAPGRTNWTSYAVVEDVEPAD